MTVEPPPPPAESRPFPAEIQFLLVVVGLLVLLSLTGLPRESDVVAGDASPALARDWAARWTHEVAEKESGIETIATSGLDRPGDKR